MLKQNLSGKVIAILGYQTLVGRIVLKKIITVCEQLPTIILV
jgi:hypothetical protein